MLLRLLLVARLCASLVAPPPKRQVSPVRAKRRLLDDDDAKEPAVDPVQWGQAGAALLATEWSNVADRIGIGELGELVEARQSNIHGTGLFATKDLEMGTLVTLYRPDLTVDDTGKALMIDQADADYFQDFQKAQAPGSRQYFVWPPGVRTSAVPERTVRGSGSRPTRPRRLSKVFSAISRMMGLHAPTTATWSDTSRSLLGGRTRVWCRCVSH